MSHNEDKQQGGEGKGEEVSMATRKSPAMEIRSNAAAPGSSAPELQGDTSASGASLEEAKTKRKRSREKQRRGAVNRGLDALMELVFMIDPRVKLEAQEREARASGGRTNSYDAPILSRVELVNTVYETLVRVHRENEQRKLFIAQLLERGLLVGGGGASAATGAAAPLPADAASFPPHIMTDIPNASNTQRQELQQQLNLEALLASSSGDQMQQSLHGARIQQSLLSNVLPEAAALLGLAARQGAASLARPPVSAQDLQQFGGMNPTASSFLGGASSLEPGLSNGGLSIPNNHQGARGDPTNNALYRAIVNRRIQDEETAALTAAGLPPIGSRSLSGVGGILDRTQPSPLSRASDTLASSARLSGADSIQQAVMRGQAIAEAAAANASNAYSANEDGPATKRSK